MTSDELARRRKGLQIASLSDSLDEAIAQHGDLYIAEIIGVMFIHAVSLMADTMEEDEE